MLLITINSHDNQSECSNDLEHLGWPPTQSPGESMNEPQCDNSSEEFPFG